MNSMDSHMQCFIKYEKWICLSPESKVMGLILSYQAMHADDVISVSDLSSYLSDLIRFFDD